MYPVSTYWDLGISDSTAIWFVQFIKDEYRVIDYYEMSGMGLEHYHRILADKGYTYGDHWLPHDVANREFTSGISRINTFKSLFGRFPRVMKKDKIEDGINAVRMVLKKCRFNRITCARGLDALKNYERKWDAKNNIFQDKPLHNWTSHGADAFRGFAMSAKLSHNDISKTLQRDAISEYNHWR
jgi:hypothetical protein